jgi:hypothetical protein
VKKEVSPAVFWVILVVVGIAAIGIGYKIMFPSYKKETTGSEADMARVKAGQPLYTPPAGAPVPGAPPAGGASPAGAPNSYNLTPPPR